MAFFNPKRRSLNHIVNIVKYSRYGFKSHEIVKIVTSGEEGFLCLKIFTDRIGLSYFRCISQTGLSLLLFSIICSISCWFFLLSAADCRTAPSGSLFLISASEGTVSFMKRYPVPMMRVQYIDDLRAKFMALAQERFMPLNDCKYSLTSFETYM